MSIAGEINKGNSQGGKGKVPIYNYTASNETDNTNYTDWYTDNSTTEPKYLISGQVLFYIYVGVPSGVFLLIVIVILTVVISNCRQKAKTEVKPFDKEEFSSKVTAAKSMNNLGIGSAINSSRTVAEDDDEDEF